MRSYSTPASAFSLICMLLALVVASPRANARQSDESGGGKQLKAEPPPRLVVFSETAGFRHSSIPSGIVCLKELATELGFEVVATEDSSVFTAEGLRGVSVVVFLNTTGDVLTPAEEEAFESWFREGGGWLGIHAAADTEYDWPFYGELVGAYFKSHPPIQPAVVVVEDRDHPSTRMLPGLWRRQDEWYTYRMNPRPNVRVLASVDESTFVGGAMDGDHPIAWCHELGAGRSLYTGGGHTDESYSEAAFRDHLRGGLRWVARQADDPKAPTAVEPEAEKADLVNDSDS